MLVINGVTAIWKASVKIMDNNTAHTKKSASSLKGTFRLVYVLKASANKYICP